MKNPSSKEGEDNGGPLVDFGPVAVGKSLQKHFDIFNPSPVGGAHRHVSAKVHARSLLPHIFASFPAGNGVFFSVTAAWWGALVWIRVQL